MKVCLLGVDFFSDNRGCAALGYSAIGNLKEICDERGESLDVFAVVFNIEKKPLNFGGVEYRLQKVAPKKLSYWNTCYKEFKKSDLILDFTGGDSFSDIYGFKRFLIATVLKRLAVFSKTPFILGPQTIGPFSGKLAAAMAKKVIRKADYCFARDLFSKDFAKKLTGKEVLLSTDVAFTLPCEVRHVITTKHNIGINPSGLLWYGTSEFKSSKHLTVDYRKYTLDLIKYLTEKTDYNIYLIPHVFSSDGKLNEDDLGVCREIKNEYPNAEIISDFDTPMEAKGVISQMDVFIGARMHATIAAFSTGVAVIPFSYSRKFEGLYQDLNYPYLVKGTVMNNEEALQKTIEWIEKPERLSSEMAKADSVLRERRDAYMTVIRNLSEKVK